MVLLHVLIAHQGNILVIIRQLVILVQQDIFRMKGIYIVENVLMELFHIQVLHIVLIALVDIIQIIIKVNAFLVLLVHIPTKEIQNVHHVQMVLILILQAHLIAVIARRVHIQMKIKQIVIIVLLVHIQIVEI